MYARRGMNVTLDLATPLRTINFRSLDFSELALRLEKRIGRELNFEAGELRRVETVGDVVEFLESVATAS
jgi:acyl carrier protein